MDCEECKLTFGKIPGRDYNYSDHEGVLAVFELKKNPTALPPELDKAEREQALDKAITEIEHRKSGVKLARAFFSIQAILAFGAVVILHLPILDVFVFAPIMRFIFTIVFAYCLAYAIVAKENHFRGYRDVLGHLYTLQGSNGAANKKE